MKIDETNYDVFYKLIQKGFDIDIFWKDAENIDGYIEVEKLYQLIQDLSVEIGNLEEQIEDDKQHIKELEENQAPCEPDPYDTWIDNKMTGE